MTHALHPPISKRSLAIPLVAALLGAGAATTTYALVDSGNGQTSQPTVVVAHPSSADSKAEPQQMGGRRP
jgi:hypothetical protein